MLIEQIISQFQELEEMPLTLTMFYFICSTDTTAKKLNAYIYYKKIKGLTSIGPDGTNTLAVSNVMKGLFPKDFS